MCGINPSVAQREHKKVIDELLFDGLYIFIDIYIYIYIYILTYHII